MDIPSSLPLNPAQLEALREPLAQPTEPSAAEQPGVTPETAATEPATQADGAEPEPAQTLLGLDVWAHAHGPKNLTAPAPQIDATTPAATTEQLAAYVLGALK